MKEPLDYHLIEKPKTKKTVLYFVIILSICESWQILLNVKTIINCYNGMPLKVLFIIAIIGAQFILALVWYVLTQTNRKYYSVLMVHLISSIIFLILYLFLI